MPMLCGGDALRFLLWQHGGGAKEKPRWPLLLAAWLNCDAVRAAALLSGVETLTPWEIDRLCVQTQEPAQRILQAEVPSKEIEKENVRFLLGSLPHGGQRQLAAFLSISPMTVSRWRLGKVQLERKYLGLLAAYFHVSPEFDMSVVPLYLRDTPVTTDQRRAWLIARLRDIDDQSLDSLYGEIEPRLSKLSRR